MSEHEQPDTTHGLVITESSENGSESLQPPLLSQNFIRDEIKIPSASSRDLQTIKLPTKMGEIVSSIPPPKEVLPSNPLPTWRKLPLDHKLPLVPHSQGEFHLSRNSLGESIYISDRGLEFDNSDPNRMETPQLDYEPLHDPNLKQFFLSNPCLLRKLVKMRLVNENGDVTCSLSEFNRYRLYIARLHKANIKEELARQGKMDEAKLEQEKRIKSWLTREGNEYKAQANYCRRETENNLQDLKQLQRSIKEKTSILKVQNDKELLLALEEEKHQALKLNTKVRLMHMQYEHKKQLQDQLFNWYCEEYCRTTNMTPEEKRKIKKQEDLEIYNKAKRELQEYKLRHEKAVLMRNRAKQMVKQDAHLSAKGDFHRKRPKDEMVKRGEGVRLPKQRQSSRPTSAPPTYRDVGIDEPLVSLDSDQTSVEHDLDNHHDPTSELEQQVLTEQSENFSLPKGTTSDSVPLITVSEEQYPELTTEQSEPHNKYFLKDGRSIKKFQNYLQVPEEDKTLLSSYPNQTATTNPIDDLNDAGLKYTDLLSKKPRGIKSGPPNITESVSTSSDPIIDTFPSQSDLEGNPSTLSGPIIGPYPSQFDLERNPTTASVAVVRSSPSQTDLQRSKTAEPVIDSDYSQSLERAPTPPRESMDGPHPGPSQTSIEAALHFKYSDPTSNDELQIHYSTLSTSTPFTSGHVSDNISEVLFPHPMDEPKRITELAAPWFDPDPSQTPLKQTEQSEPVVVQGPSKSATVLSVPHIPQLVVDQDQSKPPSALHVSPHIPQLVVDQDQSKPPSALHVSPHIPQLVVDQDQSKPLSALHVSQHIPQLVVDQDQSEPPSALHVSPHIPQLVVDKGPSITAPAGPLHEILEQPLDNSDEQFSDFSPQSSDPEIAENFQIKEYWVPSTDRQSQSRNAEPIESEESNQIPVGEINSQEDSPHVTDTLLNEYEQPTPDITFEEGYVSQSINVDSDEDDSSTPFSTLNLGTPPVNVGLNKSEAKEVFEFPQGTHSVPLLTISEEQNLELAPKLSHSEHHITESNSQNKYFIKDGKRVQKFPHYHNVSEEPKTLPYSYHPTTESDRVIEPYKGSPLSPLAIYEYTILEDSLSDIVEVIIEEQRKKVQNELDRLAAGDDEGFTMKSNESVSRVASTMVNVAVCKEFHDLELSCGESAQNPLETIPEFRRPSSLSPSASQPSPRYQYQPPPFNLVELSNSALDPDKSVLSKTALVGLGAMNAGVPSGAADPIIAPTASRTRHTSFGRNTSASPSGTIEILSRRDVSESVMNITTGRSDVIHEHVYPVESDMSTVGGFATHVEKAESHIHGLAEASISPSLFNFEKSSGITNENSAPAPSRNTTPVPIPPSQQGSSASTSTPTPTSPTPRPPPTPTPGTHLGPFSATPQDIRKSVLEQLSSIRDEVDALRREINETARGNTGQPARSQQLQPQPPPTSSNQRSQDQRRGI